VKRNRRLGHYYRNNCYARSYFAEKYLFVTASETIGGILASAIRMRALFDQALAGRFFSRRKSPLLSHLITETPTDSSSRHFILADCRITKFPIPQTKIK